jgi:prolyl oligopeptidase
MYVPHLFFCQQDELDNLQVIVEIYIFSLSGEMICRVAEDSVGAADASGREEYPWLFIEIRGFTSPVTIGLYDFSAPENKRWSIYRTTVLNGLNPDEFEATQVSFRSIISLISIHDRVR